MVRSPVTIVVFGCGVIAGLAVAALLSSPWHPQVEIETRLAAVCAERDSAIASLRKESVKLTAMTAERDRALSSVAERNLRLASLSRDAAKATAPPEGAKVEVRDSNGPLTERAKDKSANVLVEEPPIDNPSGVPPPDLCELDPSDTKSEFVVGDARLQVEIPSTIVYLPANRKYVPPDQGQTVGGFVSHSIFSFMSHCVIGADGQRHYATAGFYRVDGKAQRISFRSGDPATLEIFGTDGIGFRFKRSGNVDVFIDLAGRSFKRNIRVVRIDVCEGDAAATVVEKFGLPDEDKEVFCSWPDVVTADTLSYSPSASSNIVIANHWRYRKWPGFVLSIISDRVHRVASARPRP